MNKKITYENKITQYESQLTNQQKITSGDMNEIKQVVNSHADSLDTHDNRLSEIDDKINSGELTGSALYIQNQNNDDYTFVKTLKMTKEDVTDPSKIIQRDFVDENGNVYIGKVRYSQPNLLINGDFQVNQRGQTSYNSNGYTLDMWRVNTDGNNIITKLDNGIKFENTTNCTTKLIQHIEDISSDKSYTIVIKINNMNINDIVRLQTEHSKIENTSRFTDLQNGINVLRVSNVVFDEVFLLTRGAGSLEIEYIELFEGDIAYSHVKEDYATALMRCREYLMCYYYVRNYGILAYSSKPNDSVRTIIYLPSTFKGTPTMSYYSAEVSSTNSNNKYNVNLALADNIYGNTIHLTAIKKDGTVFDNTYDKNYMINVSKLEISCEPL